MLNVLALFLAVANADAPAAAAPQQTDYAIVRFADPPAASYQGGIPGLERTKPEPGHKLDPGSRAVTAYRQHLDNAHANYRSYLASSSKAQSDRDFYYTLNAVAVRTNGASLAHLAAGPGVRDVSYSALYRPAMNVSLGLINADELWDARAGAGAGIKVGIIDSGIDDSHPFFDCKGPIAHRAYATGLPFGSFLSEGGDHGTHVAGTVGGCVTALTSPVEATLSGVVPGVDLFDYNVFPGFGVGWYIYGGSALSHDIVDAIEDAVADGMDVINMSLGGGVQGPNDLLAQATDAAVEAGVIAAVAAGNEGPGPFTVGSPGSAAGAITAGSSTNPHYVGIPVTAGGATYGAALGAFANFGVVTAAYTVTTPANGCGSISGSLAGKIALIDRGTCTFGEKIRNAEARGAIGVLVVNNVAGDPTAMGEDGLGNGTIPAAMLSKPDGNAIKPSGTVSIEGSAAREFITTNADIIAGTSSRGPTPFTYLIKPDLTAPGVNILSSVFEGGWEFFSGTSMATPHTAGAAALLLDRHPSWTTSDVKSALVNTASRTVTDHVNGTNDPGVLTRGGGRIDLARADATPLTLAPASVSYGLWQGWVNLTASVPVSVKNVSGRPQSCSVSVTGNSSRLAVKASPASFSLTSGASTTLSVNLAGTDRALSGDYSGDVVVKCGATTLRAPWWTRVDRNPGLPGTL